MIRYKYIYIILCFNLFIFNFLILFIIFRNIYIIFLEFLLLSFNCRNNFMLCMLMFSVLHLMFHLTCVHIMFHFLFYMIHQLVLIDNLCSLILILALYIFSEMGTNLINQIYVLRHHLIILIQCLLPDMGFLMIDKIFN